MLKIFKKNFKIENIVLILSILIILNYLIVLIQFNNFLIKTVISTYIFLVLLFLFYKPWNFIALKFTLIILVLIILSNPTYLWDAWAVWLFKAKRIYFDQSLFVFFDNYSPWSHNDYPLIAPSFAASLANLVGGWNNIFPKLGFLLMCFPPLIFSTKIFKFNDNILFLILTVILINLEFTLGYVDGLVAIYFTFSAYLINEVFFNNERSIKYILITFCFLSILSLIKNEGAVLVLILLSSVILNNILNKKMIVQFDKRLIIFFSIFFFIFWKFLCYQYGIENSFLNKETISSSRDFSVDFKNLKLIFTYLILDTKFFLSLIFFLLTFYLIKNKKNFIFCTYILVFYLIVLFYTFIITTYPLLYHLETTETRVILSLSYFISFFSLVEICKKKRLIFDNNFYNG